MKTYWIYAKRDTHFVARIIADEVHTDPAFIAFKQNGEPVAIFAVHDIRWESNGPSGRN